MSIERLAHNAIPFRVELKRTFRNTNSRVGLLIEGPSGWGEFAPFPEYSHEIAGKWLAGALDSAFGIWPTPLRQHVPVNAIIPALAPADAKQMAATAISKSGISTFKIKVASERSGDFREDLARVIAVREAAREAEVTAIFRVDANGAWTVAEAREYLPQIADAVDGLDYVEQPCMTLAELAELKKLIDIRVAVDEGLRFAARVDGQYADGINIKDCADVMIVKSIPLGGAQRALHLIHDIGLPVVVSGSMDTSIGLMSGLALAGCVPELYGACGLGTGALLAQDVVMHTQNPEHGYLSLTRIEPQAESLGVLREQVSAQEHDEWMSRMIAAWYASGNQLVDERVAHMVEQW